MIALLRLIFMDALFAAGINFLRIDIPVGLVVTVSAVIGLLMVLVFRYTSNQSAIRLAKDALKANLLAVRLFQDQIPVVLRSYVRMLAGTGRYLKLAFKPLLFVILPLILLISQLDRYLGFAPIAPGHEFLIKVCAANPDNLDALSLQLPPEMMTTAPPVHIAADNEVVWRVVAEKDGNYSIKVGVPGNMSSKQAVVSSEVARLSPVRLRGQFWNRLFFSSEPALPDNSPMQAVEVRYLARSIHFAWLDWNWIWLFFVLSLVAGFFFKTVLRIEI